MNATSLMYQSVEFIPEQLKPGILYVSHKYKTASHLCCCGCGEEIVTPIMPTEWKLTIKNNKPTLYPSIGNWSLPCRSHYWIKNGHVEWSYQMSEMEIQRGREWDRQQKECYYQTNNQEELQKGSNKIPAWVKSSIEKIKNWIEHK